MCISTMAVATFGCLRFSCTSAVSLQVRALFFQGPVAGNMFLFPSPGTQVIHGTATLGKPKVDSARDRMLDVNPNIKVETFPEQLTSENALRICEGYDVVSQSLRITPQDLQTAVPPVFVIRFNGVTIESFVFRGNTTPNHRRVVPVFEYISKRKSGWGSHLPILDWYNSVHPPCDKIGHSTKLPLGSDRRSWTEATTSRPST